MKIYTKMSGPATKTSIHIHKFCKHKNKQYLDWIVTPCICTRSHCIDSHRVTCCSGGVSGHLFPQYKWRYENVGWGWKVGWIILELLTLCCLSKRMLQSRGKQSNHTLSARAVSMWQSWAVANRNWTVLVDLIDSITLDWRMIRCARAALRVRLVACSSPFWSTVPTLWRSRSISSYKHSTTNRE
jgi:hypothetical protein